MSMLKKIFLCHASEDKEYVRILAKSLTRKHIIFDELCFKPGEDFRSEIIDGLNKSSIFVFIASKKSIEKYWCKYELDIAEQKSIKGEIEKSLALIIDNTLTPDQLPAWISKVKCITSSAPSLAATDIQSILFSIISTESKREFIGRSKEQELFINELAEKSPHVMVIYGVDGIGRKTFIERQVHENLNLRIGPYVIIEKNYTIDDIYPILLEKIANIETIKQLKDNISLFRTLSYNKKLEEILKQIDIICDNSRAPCFVDVGGMLNEQGEYHRFIGDILDHICNSNNDQYCVFIQRRKPKTSRLNESKMLLLPIPPLSKNETTILLKNLLSKNRIKFSAEQISCLIEQIAGYPPSAYFVCKYINFYGIDIACERLYDIVDYNSKYVSPFLSSIDLTEPEKEILRYMASESIMSIDAIATALGKPIEEVASIVKNLIDLCLINQYEGEYMLSSPIRNSVFRKLGVLDNDCYKDVLKRLSDKFWKDENIAPSISVIDATIHSAVRANVPIGQYNCFINESTLLRFAESFYRQREWRKTLLYANRVLELRPDSECAIALTFKSYVQLEEWEKANEFLKKAKNTKKYYYYEGFLYKNQRKYNEAIASFEKAINIGDKHYSVYRDYADALFNLGRFSEAEKNLNIVLTKDKGNIFVLDLLVRIYEKQNKIEESRNTIKLLEKEDHDECFIHHRMADLLLSEHKYKEALAEAEIAISKNRNLFEAKGQKANILLEYGKLDEAWRIIDAISCEFKNLRLDVQTGLKCKYFIKKEDWESAMICYNQIGNHSSPQAVGLLLMLLKGKINDAKLGISERMDAENELKKLLNKP